MNRYAVIDNETNQVVNIIISDGNYTKNGFTIVLSNDIYENQFQQYLKDNFGIGTE